MFYRLVPPTGEIAVQGYFVAKGNRFALMVNAARADFGGDLNLEFKDLPPGVTVETLVVSGGLAQNRLFLREHADA